MKLYADTPARATRQVLADVLFLLWLLMWVMAGNAVHDATLELAGPGRQTQDSATSLAESMQDAGDALDDVPIVGDSARAPFDQAAEASGALADAGQAEVEAVEGLAFWLRLAVTLIPILVIGALFVPVRWRFVREATAGQRFVDAEADLQLFALRAMSNQPMHQLARVSADPVGAWQRGDRDVVHALAKLEMRSLGLKPPRLSGA
ncbi:MAG: hypothetical protein ACJ72P_04980 [Nocardioides sp.]